MKILFLTSNNARSGGAISIHRLHQLLGNNFHESKIFLGTKHSLSRTELHIAKSGLMKLMDSLAYRLSSILSLPDLYRPSSRNLIHAINDFTPDIIHLHWLYGARGSDCVPLSILSRLSRRYPICWTFHDMWGMTGGCTNSLSCIRWLSGCGNCPQMTSKTSVRTINLKHDSTSFFWKMKKHYYQNTDMTIICPSKWLAEKAKMSPLLGKQDIRQVFNSIDTSLFFPKDKQECMNTLSIPLNKRVILFVGKASSVFAYGERIPIFESVINELSRREQQLVKNILVLLIGKDSEALSEHLKVDTLCLGSVNSQELMATAYAASDVLLYTSLYDNLPGVIQESLACGTPVVSSDVGGINELVHEGVNGYLVQPGNIEEYTNRLLQILDDRSISKRLSEGARDTATRDYSNPIILKQLMEIYEITMAHHDTGVR